MFGFLLPSLKYKAMSTRVFQDGKEFIFLISSALILNGPSWDVWQIIRSLELLFSLMVLSPVGWEARISSLWKYQVSSLRFLVITFHSYFAYVSCLCESLVLALAVTLAQIKARAG